MKKILYFMVASVFIGAKIFSIDIGIMNISLYRMGLFVMIFYLLLNNLFLDKSFTIKIKDRQSLIIRSYFLWMLYAIYSLAWVLDLKAGIKTLFFLITGFLCIWIFSTIVREEKDFKNIFNIMLLMVFLHNALGWFELQTGIYLFADLSKVDRYNKFSYDKAARLPVTLFANPNDFATLMTFGVFVSFIVFLNTKKVWLKIFSILTGFSSVILILRSGSRGNMVGLLLGLTAIMILFLFKNVNKYVLISIGVFAVMVILLYPPFNQKLISVIQNRILSRFGSQSMSIRSDAIRFNLIKNGLFFLVQTIGFGTGVGNIEYWMAERSLFNVAKISNMHNWWMEILVAYGIIVFVIYVLIYLLKLHTFIIAYFKSNDSFIKNTSLCLFGFMMSYVVSSVSSSSNIDTEWIWLLWAVIISFIGYIIRDFNQNKKIETREVN